MKLRNTLVLVVMILLATSLACSAPADDDSTSNGSLTVTPAPSQAADDTPAPMATQASGPQTFTGEGVKNDYSSEGAVCQVYEPVTLVVKGDGTAELTTQGADIVDHTMCTTGNNIVTWYMNGTVDATAQTVAFQTCNFGRFSAAGSVSFAQGVVAGEVSCINKEGVKFITLVIGQ